MALIEVKAYNLLVHYGENYQKNLLDLLEEGLLDALVGERMTDDETMLPVKVETTKLKGHTFLHGYFYRSSTLSWDYVPDAKERFKEDPGTQEVMPRARFFLDLNIHRLFWATERGKTHSPYASNFLTYIRATVLRDLREKYRADAEALWHKRKKPKRKKGQRSQTRAQFINEYLNKHNLTKRAFKMALIPESSNEKVIGILKKKSVVIQRATFFPVMNNVTKDHLEALFTTTAELGAETKAESQVTLKSTEKESGLVKEPIFKLFRLNENKNLLRFEFLLKDKDQPGDRSFKIANNNPEENSEIQKVETLRDDLDSEDLLASIDEKVDGLQDRGISDENIEQTRAKIRMLLR